MGGLFGSKTTNTTSNKGYADWQESYLKGANQSAQDIYNRQASQGYYTGPTYAGINDYSKQAINGTVGYATGTGGQLADAVSRNALALGGTGGRYAGALDAYMKAASTDPTQANIAAAAQYADNPYLKAQIDQAGQDVTRNLNEVVLPSIDRTATATGGVNSTRAGIAEGLASRAATEELGDIATSMRYNAYNNGLNLSEGARRSNMAALGDATAQYGNATGLSANMAGSAADMAYQNFDRQNQAGRQLQEDEQGRMDDAYNRWAGKNAFDWDLLNNMYGITGNSWGSSGTSTQKTSGNLVGQGLGAIQSGLGAYAKWKKM